MSATIKTWVNGLAPTCEDADLNGFKSENNNLIVGAGMGLSTGDNQQTHKAVAHYAGVGDYYVDSGSGTAYVLGITGTQIAPPTYANGMRIRFVAGNTNTGAVTINVAGLGVKALVRDLDGAALNAGDIQAGSGTEAYYDGTSFRVVSSARTVVPSKGTFIPTFEGLTTAGTGWAYTDQLGSWRRQGNHLLLMFRCRSSTIGAGAAGVLVMTLNLPFSDIDTTIGGVQPAGILTGTSGITLTANNGYLASHWDTSLPDALLFRENWGVSNHDLDIADMAASTVIAGSILLPLVI